MWRISTKSEGAGKSSSSSLCLLLLLVAANEADDVAVVYSGCEISKAEGAATDEFNDGDNNLSFVLLLGGLSSVIGRQGLPAGCINKGGPATGVGVGTAVAGAAVAPDNTRLLAWLLEVFGTTSFQELPAFECKDTTRNHRQEKS